jgi:hypothetical protein
VPSRSINNIDDLIKNYTEKENKKNLITFEADIGTEEGTIEVKDIIMQELKKNEKLSNNFYF